MQSGQRYFAKSQQEEEGHIKVRVPAALRGVIHAAIQARDYASIDEVMAEALYDWAQKRHRELRTLHALHERAAQAMRTLSTGALPPAQRERLLQETRELLQGGRSR
jgi:Arc/MetJ-type ribon-helix-helix transcriptional regulator